MRRKVAGDGLSPLGEEERETSAQKEGRGDRGCWLLENKSGSSCSKKHWEEEVRPTPPLGPSREASEPSSEKPQTL